jgi:hypothetical protein
MVRTRPFWHGRGYFLEPVHGELMMYAATPRHVIEELERAKFGLLGMIGADYPARGRHFVTPWYYYAFRALSTS